MAARMPADYQPRPEVGDILVVIHDFLARSSDELSLGKGDRVELIERDDEFGDGWFLGRHMVNGNSGLFPEVYTRPAPKGVTSTVTAPRVFHSQSSSTNGATTDQNGRSLSVTTASTDGRPATSHGASSSKSSKFESKPVTLPLNAAKQENKAPVSAFSTAKGGYGSINRITTHSQDSPVLHETLTVIDEHMNDLHSQPSNGALNATDSGSEYSNQLQDRLSYIQGEETDEEEDVAHTRAQVEAWGADDVAEYLFTAGVEKKHCEVFRDQEISGEVLLGMDQSSLFLKAFDLGSVGRRLKTWQKIKSLQDEVNGLSRQSRKSDAGSEGSKRMRSRNNTLTQKQASVDGSMHNKRLSQSTPKIDPISPITPVSPLVDSPTQSNHHKRPSAASVRDLHHSRRHSSTDYRLTGTTLMSSNTPKIAHAGTFPLGDPTANTSSSHKKQPSFDRNWTMGNASSSTSPSQRPLSSAGLHMMNNSEENVATEDLDRGYFSGTDVDGRNRRNVLKKRSDSLAGHSHKGSYTEEQRVRSATALSRHSRFGSMDSTRDPPSAAAKYYGLTGNHRRTASTNTTESVRGALPSKDSPSPTVTKLDNGEVEISPTTPSNRQAMHPEWLAKSAKLSGFGSLRAISDAVTGHERAKLASPSDSSLKESPMRSPSRAGSSTPSAGPSFELDSPDMAKSPLSATTTTTISSQPRKPKTKTKKETSAYQRGLQKIGPREAIQNSDYSGWMKKKNSHLMTTWKPRLFVLKGRRLAYYYSEEDTEEKGLIDISFHRVLPADNERLTGLHATLTGASNTPMVPVDSSLQTGADVPSAADVVEKGNDAMFIFKLVPPRAGLSRAVNFTKPTVHYFAVPNLKQGRMWMAALMKATIDRDDTKPMTSTYQQKTISLAKARQMRHRPPALMNLDEKIEESPKDVDDEKKNGLGITFGEVDSAISGVEKLALQKIESANAQHAGFSEKGSSLPSFMTSPQSA